VPKEEGNLLVFLASNFVLHFFNKESKVLSTYVRNLTLKSRLYTLQALS